MTFVRTQGSRVMRVGGKAIARTPRGIFAPPSGGGGGGTPGAGTSLPTLTLRNNDAAVATGRATSYWQGFQRGAVPGAAAGTVRLKAAIGASAVPLQQDGETYYGDGSLRAAVLTLKPASVPATATTETIEIGTEAGAPNRAESVTLAALAAATDFRVQLTGYDFGTDVLQLRVNDVIADGNDEPWGTNPAMGYRKVRSGPICTEWMFWSYARRVSDGAYHRWVKIKLWVRAFPNGTYAIRGRVLQPNTFGAFAGGTIGAATHGSHFFLATLVNGAATLHRWGGPSDPRVLAVAGTAFDVAGQTVTIPAAYVPNGAAIVLQPAGGATMPAGLPADTVLFGATKGAEGNTKLRLYRYRRASLNWTAPPAWISGRSITNADAIVVNTSGVAYTPGPLDGSATPAGVTAVMPTGPGPFQDGNIIWNCYTGGPFTAQGAGTINVVPVCATFPSCGMDLADLETAERVWVGTTRPRLFAAPDRTYQFHRATIAPPFAPGIVIAPLVTAPRFWPGAATTYPVDMNESGSGDTDERIGNITYSGSRALLLPFDENHRKAAMRQAGSFSEYFIWSEDEASGTIVVTNNGATNDATPYPGLPMRFKANVWPANSNGPIAPSLAHRDHYSMATRYYARVDPSHIPKPGYGAYLLSGDDAFLDQVLNEWTTNANSYFSQDNKVAGGVTRNRVGVVINAEGRRVAWGLSLLGAAYAMCPATRPERAYVHDFYHNVAAYTGDVWRGITSAAMKNLGFMYLHDPAASSTMQLWMEDYRFWSVASEAIVGDAAGFQDVAVNLFANCVLGRVDGARGGCAYYASVRSGQIYLDNANRLPDALQADYSGVYQHTYAVNPAGIAITQYGAPASWGGCPTANVLKEYSTLLSGATLPVFVLGSIAYCCRLGVPGALALLGAYQNRLVEASGGAAYLGRIQSSPQFAYGYVP